MADWIHRLLNGDIYNIVSLAIGVAGIVLAFYFSRRNPVSKRVLYRTKGANIVNKKANDIPNLQIQFNTSDITVLTETTIHFWNAGNASIGTDDMPAGAPLCVQVPDGAQILSCSIEKVDGPGVDITLPDVFGSKSATIAPKCIERGKGALLKILHTHPSETGAFIGGIITDHGAPKKVSPRLTARRLVSGLDIVLLSIAFAFVIFRAWVSYRSAGFWSAAGVWLAALVLSVLAVALVGSTLEPVLLRLRRRLVAPSVWEYERSELSKIELDWAGEKD